MPTKPTKQPRKNLQQNFLEAVRDRTDALETMRKEFEISERLLTRWLQQPEFRKRMIPMLRAAKRRQDLELRLGGAFVKKKILTIAITANDLREARLACMNVKKVEDDALKADRSAKEIVATGPAKQAAGKNKCKPIQTRVHPNASPDAVEALLRDIEASNPLLRSTTA